MNYTDEDLTGCLSASLAGHDKGSLYFIINNKDDIVYLADGLKKTVDNPKKKKLKHVQINKKIRLESDSLNDTGIKRAIKLFLKEGKEAN
jgi:ribosomal protein L14E/L6E/L27E